MPAVDANSRGIAMAVTDNAAQTPVRPLVDPVSGRLLVTIVAGTSGGVAPTRDTVDANSRDTALAVTDDAAQGIRPFATTTEGYLLVDVA